MYECKINLSGVFVTVLERVEALPKPEILHFYKFFTKNRGPDGFVGPPARGGGSLQVTFFVRKSLILNNLRIPLKCFFYKRCLFFAKNETYFTISPPNTLYLVIVIT